MSQLTPFLELGRCPHCGVARPSLILRDAVFSTRRHDGENVREWGIYTCRSCGGVVSAYVNQGSQNISATFPSMKETSDDIPEPARKFLRQARESFHAPAAAVLLAASAVDAMLRAKNFNDGRLNDRIKAAAAAHLLTPAMQEWANDVRLDANDQRHADPDADDSAAEKCVAFAEALGEYLFVLPARVNRGRAGSPQ